MTLHKYQTSLFEESEVWTLSVADFRAKLSQLQGIDEVSKILEELYFLKSLGSHLFSDLSIYSLRTLKDCSIIKKGILSRPCSESWMNWGTTWNGKCLTAKILESPRTGNVCLLSDILEENVPEEFFLSAEKNEQSDTESKIKVIGNTKNPNGSSKGTRTLVYDKNGIVGALMVTDYKVPKQVAIPVLTPERVNKRQNGRRFKTNGEPMFTLTAQDQHGILIENKKLKIREATTKGYAEAGVGDSVNIANINSKTKRGRVGNQIANTLLASEQQGVVGSDYRIRRLTPRECWRLQGFPDSAFDKAQAVTSNSQLYKQAGNSVTVNVIAEIAKYFKEDEG